MNAQVIIAQFKLQADWFVNALKDISDEESNIRAEEYANPVKWIAGHLLTCRMSIIEILTGVNPDSNYQAMFGKGTTWKADRAYPKIEDITSQWVQIAAEMTYHLENVQSEAWQSTAPFQTSIPDNSLLGLVAYFSIHEGFHIGQLSLLRKSQGKPAMYMGRIVNRTA